MDKPKYRPVCRQNCTVCCIALSSTDCIRLVAVPSDLINPLRDSILRSGYKIKEEHPYHGSHQFKLTGNPWFGAMEDAVTSRRLLVQVLTTMVQNGWNLIQAADTSKRLNDKDSLYFELTQPDPDAKLFGLSFNMADRIRLIDAPEFMRDVLKWAVEPLTKIKRETDYYGSFEIKLAGHPWNNSGADEVQARYILCHVIADFRAVGYKLYASVDISGGEGADLESWVFRKVSDNYA